MKYESDIKVKLINDYGKEIVLSTNDIGKRATIITKVVTYENCIITSLNVDAMKIRSGDYNVTYRIEYENILSIRFNRYNLLMREKYRNIFYSALYKSDGDKYLCYKPNDLGNYRTSFTDEEIEEIKKDIPYLFEMFEKVEAVN